MKRSCPGCCVTEPLGTVTHGEALAGGASRAAYSAHNENLVDDHALSRHDRVNRPVADHLHRRSKGSSKIRAAAPFEAPRRKFSMRGLTPWPGSRRIRMAGSLRGGSSTAP